MNTFKVVLPLLVVGMLLYSINYLVSTLDTQPSDSQDALDAIVDMIRRYDVVIAYGIQDPDFPTERVETDSTIMFCPSVGDTVVFDKESRRLIWKGDLR